MRRICKLLLPLVPVLFILTVPFYAKASGPVYVNPDSGFEVIIDDDADLLTEEEEGRVLEAMKPISDYSTVSFVTTLNDGGSETRFAQNYNDSLAGNTKVLFLIDMATRQIYIDSTGSMRNTITGAASRTITDNVYRYASKQQYCECAAEAFEQINALCEGNRIAQPMKHINNFLIAVMISLVLNYIFVRVSSKQKETKNLELLDGVLHRIEVVNPQSELISVRREYNSGSSGSGGGGGGGGGGGHSGGGHGF